jgi:hypothetical protein
MTVALEVGVLLALVALLVVEELLRAYGGRAAVWSRRLVIPIVPTLFAFAFVIYTRVRGLG